MHGKRCYKGDTIVREGDQADSLYLIQDGDFEIIKGMGSEQEIILARMKPGDFFGEMAFLDREPRSASVIALSDGFLLMIEGREFTRIMERYPTIPINICKELTRRLRELHKQFKS